MVTFCFRWMIAISQQILMNEPVQNHKRDWEEASWEALLHEQWSNWTALCSRSLRDQVVQIILYPDIFVIWSSSWPSTTWIMRIYRTSVEKWASMNPQNCITTSSIDIIPLHLYLHPNQSGQNLTFNEVTLGYYQSTFAYWMASTSHLHRLSD